MKTTELEKHGLKFSFDSDGNPEVSSILSPHLNPEDMLREAIGLCVNDKVQEGVKYFEALLENADYRLNALQNLANSYFQLEDFYQAMHYGLKALDIEYLNAFTHRTLCKIYMKLEQIYKAEEHLIVAMSIDDSDKENIMLRSEVSGYKNQFFDYHFWAADNTIGQIYLLDRKVDSGFKYDFTRYFIDEGQVGDPEFRSDILWNIFGDLDKLEINVPVIIFEYGWLKQLGVKVFPYKAKEWKGENLDNKTILVYTEQGLGDNLLRLSYFRQMKEKYKCKIIYATYHNLREVVEMCGYIDEYCPMIFDVSVLTKVDYTANIYRLAKYFDIVHKSPSVLSVSYDLRSSLDYPNVIVNWLARRNSPTLSLKSIDLNALANILREYDNVHFYCCQPKIEKKNVLRDIKEFNLPVKYVESNSISDLAMYVSKSECVITIDSLHAHMGGCLDANVAMVLPSNISFPFWGKDIINIPYYSSSFNILRGPNWPEKLVKYLNKILKQIC